MPAKTPDAIDVHVGLRIRVERLARGLSQTALADQLGVTFQQVQKYENGRNRVGAGRLTRIAEILGVQITALMPAARDAAATAADPGIRLALQVLTMPGGRELLSAYAAIASREDRNAIVRIAQACACAQPPIALAEAS